MGVKTPIIALTGNALKSDRELFFEAGVDEFQTKVRACLHPATHIAHFLPLTSPCTAAYAQAARMDDNNIDSIENTEIGQDAVGLETAKQ
jgi:CheY-like chemotaxis protein